MKALARDVLWRGREASDPGEKWVTAPRARATAESTRVRYLKPGSQALKLARRAVDQGGVGQGHEFCRAVPIRVNHTLCPWHLEIVLQSIQVEKGAAHVGAVKAGENVAREAGGGGRVEEKAR